MNYFFLLLILLSFPLNADQNDKWFKEVLMDRLENLEEFDLEEIKERTKNILANSTPCAASLPSQDDFNFYIFMTFDLPDQLWIEYSKSLEKIGGAFAIRGLPNNSFLSFARKVKNLREKGVSAPIQLNPQLFIDYQIECSPTMALIQGRICDKISGSISVDHAVEKFAKEGETTLSSTLLERIRGGKG